MPNHQEPHMSIEKIIGQFIEQLMLKALNTPQIEERVRTICGSENFAAGEQNNQPEVEANINKPLLEENQRLQEEIEVLKTAETTLEKSVRIHTQNEQQLTDELSNSNTQNQNLEKKQAALQTEVEALQQTEQQLTTELNNSSTQNQNLEKKQAVLQTEVEALQQTEQQLTTELNNSSTQNQNLEKKQAVLQTEVEALQQTEQQLTTELNNSSTQNQNLEKNQAALQTEVEALQQTKQQLTTELQPFSADISSLQKFNQLGETTQTALQGIFKESSINGFIACGLQEKNLHSLWDYTKNRLMEQPDDETDILVTLFLFFFSRYRLAYPQFQLQEVTEGERFDPEQHIRSSQSLPSGAISKVILSGWINNKTQKIIKTSLVEINA